MVVEEPGGRRHRAGLSSFARQQTTAPQSNEQMTESGADEFQPDDLVWCESERSQKYKWRMIKMKMDINIEPNLGIRAATAQQNAKRNAETQVLSSKKTTPKEGFEPERRWKG
jgi:hypothetical protein